MWESRPVTSLLAKERGLWVRNESLWFVPSLYTGFGGATVRLTASMGSLLEERSHILTPQKV